MPIARIGNEFIVNSTTPGFQGLSSVTALSDGRFVVAFASADTGDGSLGCVRARMYNSNGTPSGSDFIVNSTAANDQSLPSVTALANGRFIVSWNSADAALGAGNIVRARFFDAGGAPAGNDFIVSTTLSPGFSYNSPEIAALSDGRFFAAWSSADTGDGLDGCIRGRFFGASGAPLGNDFIVNTTAVHNQTNPSVTVLGNGRYLVTWDSYQSSNSTPQGVRGRIFNADGTPSGSDFIVNSTNPAAFPGSESAVAAFPDGRSAVVFASGEPNFNGQFFLGTIRVRFFDPGGAPAGNDVLVIAESNYFDNIQTVVLADGRLMVSFASHRIGLGGSAFGDIRAVLLDPNGTLLDSFYVRGSLSDSTHDSSLTALADGRVVVTWSTNDGSGVDIHSQIFDPTVFSVGHDFGGVYYGGSLNDTITGGGGADTLAGLIGNDVIFGEAGGDQLYGGGGADQLYGGSGADHLSGGDDADYLSGGADNDVLYGGAGADIMVGGAGDDQYYVDSAGDVAVEYVGGGNDRVFASVSYQLNAGSEIETLSTDNSSGTAAVNLTGNEFANVIYGNNGNNTLDGRGAADVMWGLAGNDQYFVDNGFDQVVEFAGGGNDRVSASVSYLLAAGAEVETLSTTFNAGVAAINLSGNEFANFIFGNNGSNILDGGLGNDIIYGLAGADYFAFSTAPNGASNVDVIADFVSADDLIFIDDAAYSGMAAGFLSAAAFLSGAGLISAATAAQRVIHNTATGDLYYDQDGAGGLASVRFANVGAGQAVFNYDFFGV